MKINTLFNIPGSRKPSKRVGRGIGSGKGNTCGRGQKGQKSRSGVAIKTEGGQMPIIKRLPKRGFNCNKSINYILIKLADLEALITDKRIDSSVLIDKTGLIKIGFIKNDRTPVKLLGGLKKISYKLTVKLDAYSASASAVIQQAGGQVL